MADPTVGQIVHYFAADAFGDNGTGPYAAIVSKVVPELGTVNLMVCMAGWTPVTSVEPEDNNPDKYWAPLP